MGRALEKLACSHCGGEGYIDNHGAHEDEAPFDVCAYCLSTGSEKYTQDSMENGELHRQINEMIEYARQLHDIYDGEGRNDALEEWLDSYDPERLAEQADAENERRIEEGGF